MENYASLQQETQALEPQLRTERQNVLHVKLFGVASWTRAGWLHPKADLLPRQIQRRSAKNSKIWNQHRLSGELLSVCQCRNFQSYSIREHDGVFCFQFHLFSPSKNFQKIPVSRFRLACASIPFHKGNYQHPALFLPRTRNGGTGHR